MYRPPAGCPHSHKRGELGTGGNGRGLFVVSILILAWVLSGFGGAYSRPSRRHSLDVRQRIKAPARIFPIQARPVRDPLEYRREHVSVLHRWDALRGRRIAVALPIDELSLAVHVWHIVATSRTNHLIQPLFCGFFGVGWFRVWWLVIHGHLASIRGGWTRR